NPKSPKRILLTLQQVPMATSGSPSTMGTRLGRSPLLEQSLSTRSPPSTADLMASQLALMATSGSRSKMETRLARLQPKFSINSSIYSIDLALAVHIPYIQAASSIEGQQARLLPVA